MADQLDTLRVYGYLSLQLGVDVKRIAESLSTKTTLITMTVVVMAWTTAIVDRHFSLSEVGLSVSTLC